jgi:hypothetical protein
VEKTAPVLFIKYNFNYLAKGDNIIMACRTHGGEGSAYRILVGKPEGKRPLERLRCKWDDNIMTGCGGTEWIDWAQDRDQWRAVVNTEINRKVP